MYRQLSFLQELEAEKQLTWSQLPLPEAEVIMYQNVFDKNEGDQIFSELYGNTDWQQDTTRLYGKPVTLPRLTAWYGDQDKSYTYSKIKMEPRPWTPTLIGIKLRIESIANKQFNSVLLNFYRDGKDSIAWHSDDEPELGKNPVIASVSLGAVRRFMFKHKYKKELKFEIELNNGSLLIMKGETQHFWQHQIPKTAKKVQPRINLTFREII